MSEDVPQIITPEQKAAIEKDTQEALNQLATTQKNQEIEAAKAAGKEEAKREFELAQRLKEQEDTAKKLASQLEEQKKMFEEQQKSLRAKIDELSTSKMPVQVQDPFKAQQQSQSFYDKISQDPDLYRKIEEASKAAFFNKN